MAAYGRARCRALGGVNASLHSFCADDGHANCGVWIAVICSGTSGAEDWFTQLQTFTLDRLNPWFQHTDGMPVCAGRAISGGILRRSTQQIGARHWHQRWRRSGVGCLCADYQSRSRRAYRCLYGRKRRYRSRSRGRSRCSFCYAVGYLLGIPPDGTRWRAAQWC